MTSSNHGNTPDQPLKITCRVDAVIWSLVQSFADCRNKKRNLSIRVKSYSSRNACFVTIVASLLFIGNLCSGMFLYEKDAAIRPNTAICAGNDAELWYVNSAACMFRGYSCNILPSSAVEYWLESKQQVTLSTWALKFKSTSFWSCLY